MANVVQDGELHPPDQPASKSVIDAKFGELMGEQFFIVPTWLRKHYRHIPGNLLKKEKVNRKTGEVMVSEEISYLTPTEWTIVEAIMNYSWRADNTAWPSKETIAREVGLDPRTVQCYFHRIEKKGFLSIGSRFDPETGGQLTNHYSFAPLIERGKIYLKEQGLLPSSGALEEEGEMKTSPPQGDENLSPSAEKSLSLQGDENLSQKRRRSKKMKMETEEKKKEEEDRIRRGSAAALEGKEGLPILTLDYLNSILQQIRLQFHDRAPQSSSNTRVANIFQRCHERGMDKYEFAEMMCEARDKTRSHARTIERPMAYFFKTLGQDADAWCSQHDEAPGGPGPPPQQNAPGASVPAPASKPAMSLSQAQELEDHILAERDVSLARDEVAPGRYLVCIEYEFEQWLRLTCPGDYDRPTPVARVRIKQAVAYQASLRAAREREEPGNTPRLSIVRRASYS